MNSFNMTINGEDFQSSMMSAASAAIHPAAMVSTAIKPAMV